MRVLPILLALAFSGAVASAQAPATAPKFDVASVRACEHLVGPDENNQLRFSPSGFTARNATLKRLVAEAYGVQINQVIGPVWLDRNEYDIDARSASSVPSEQLAAMLRGLLAERFNLRQHSESRPMRAYELVIDKAGLKIHPANDVAAGTAAGRFHFNGNMRQFADLLAVQLSIPAAVDPSTPSRASGPPIPVLDKTGLAGTYDFSVDIRPELGADLFTLWQRVLRDQLGLRLENQKGSLTVIVVDSAASMPTEN